MTSFTWTAGDLDSYSGGLTTVTFADSMVVLDVTTTSLNFELFALQPDDQLLSAATATVSLGSGSNAYLVAPRLARLDASRFLCVYRQTVSFNYQIRAVLVDVTGGVLTVYGPFTLEAFSGTSNGVARLNVAMLTSTRLIVSYDWTRAGTVDPGQTEGWDAYAVRAIVCSWTPTTVTALRSQSLLSAGHDLYKVPSDLMALAADQILLPTVEGEVTGTNPAYSPAVSGDVLHLYVYSLATATGVTLNIAGITADTTHAAWTRTKAALQAKGHTVTAIPSPATADFTGYDLIVVVRATRSSALSTKLAAELANRPVVIALLETGSVAGTGNLSMAKDLGIVGTAEVSSSGSSSGSIDTIAHPITNEFFPGSQQFLAGTNWEASVDASAAFVGTRLEDSVTTGMTVQPNLVAAAAGTTMLDGTTTYAHRLVVWGQLYAGQTDYSAAGKNLLEAIVQWATGHDSSPDELTQLATTALADVGPPVYAAESAATTDNWLHVYPKLLNLDGARAVLTAEREWKNASTANYGWDDWVWDVTFNGTSLAVAGPWRYDSWTQNDLIEEVTVEAPTFSVPGTNKVLLPFTTDDNQDPAGSGGYTRFSGLLELDIDARPIVVNDPLIDLVPWPAAVDPSVILVNPPTAVYHDHAGMLGFGRFSADKVWVASAGYNADLTLESDQFFVGARVLSSYLGAFRVGGLY